MQKSSSQQIYQIYQNFRDMIDLMYKCGKEAEATHYHLLRYNFHTFYGTELLNHIYAIDYQ